MFLHEDIYIDIDIHFFLYLHKFRNHMMQVFGQNGVRGPIWEEVSIHGLPYTERMSTGSHDLPQRNREDCSSF